MEYMRKYKQYANLIQNMLETRFNLETCITSPHIPINTLARRDSL